MKNESKLKKILSLSKELISLKSTPDNKDALNRALELCLAELKDFKVEHFEKNGVKSVLVYNSKKRPKQFKLLLNAHLDIIPAKDFQFKPVIRNNRLYGAGALDMKSNTSCLIAAFKEVANNVDYPLAIQLVTDEEIGGFEGTKYQIDQGVRSEFVLAGETTNFGIVNQAKGILWVKVTSKGKTAHGAYPWRGKNAIWEMQEFLEKLKKRYPVPKTQKWQTTVNLARIETSNAAFNKIPDDCSVSLDVRFVPSDKDTVLKQIKQILPKGFSIEVLANEPAMFVDESHPLLQKLQAITKRITKKKVPFYSAQGSSDARHYFRVKGQGIEFGPIGEGIGSDNEWIDIQSLEKYYQVLTEFMYSLNN